jgi:alkylation response protein AidB-like acyl-CoA dehydrogenase
MDFELEDHHRDLQANLRRFFDAEAPLSLITALDSNETFPSQILDQFVDLGLWGAACPVEFGGAEVDEISRCIMVEEMHRAGACLTYAFMPTALYCAPAIAKFGTPEQARELLPRIAAGELLIAMGLSEPEAGSDLMSLTTRASRDGEDWVVRGQKVFTTGADAAGHILTLVRTDPGSERSRGLSVLLIPTDSDGITVQPLKKLAGQATHTCEVWFDDVRVPRDALLGEEGRGAEIVFHQLDADRVYTAAQSLGTATGAFDLALRHAQERVQFGRPIIEHQAVGHALADMAMRIDSGRMLTWRAAKLLEEKRPCSAEAAMAKVVASEAATFCAANGMQILGGYSYIVESGMERYYREAKIQEIFAGTNQILRNVIVRGLN